jgi:hypothetical protein
MIDRARIMRSCAAHFDEIASAHAAAGRMPEAQHWRFQAACLRRDLVPREVGKEHNTFEDLARFMTTGRIEP